ncbi:MAG: hypothetical protein GYA21_03590 [Myxococcales bacterium]|nr:hypothetical protein [Myxococcales bacterium]
MRGDFSFVLTLVLLFALGVLALAAKIVQKKPNAAELLGKLSKASGVIGIIAALWGVYDLISTLSNISWIARVSVLLLLTALAIEAVFIVLGFIFGYAMVASLLNEQAKAKGEAMRQKLTGFQTTLGYASLILCAWLLLVRIFPRLMFF